MDVSSLRVPTTPLKSITRDTGELPLYRISRRGSRIMFRLSWSLYAAGLLALLTGITLLLFNGGFYLNLLGQFLILSFWIIPFSGFVLSKSRFGPHFEIDLSNQKVTISHGSTVKCFELSQVAGLQLLKEPKSEGYQINLITFDENGEIERTSIIAYSYRYYARRMANQISKLSNIQIIDQ